MVPIPHPILFVPICVFTSLAVAVAMTQFLAWIVTPRRKPAHATAARPTAARPTAQIYYFTPDKSPLRFYSDHGGQRLAVPHAARHR